MLVIGICAIITYMGGAGHGLSNGLLICGIGAWLETLAVQMNYINQFVYCCVLRDFEFGGRSVPPFMDWGNTLPGEGGRDLQSDGFLEFAERLQKFAVLSKCAKTCFILCAEFCKLLHFAATESTLSVPPTMFTENVAL